MLAAGDATGMPWEVLFLGEDSLVKRFVRWCGRIGEQEKRRTPLTSVRLLLYEK